MSYLYFQVTYPETGDLLEAIRLNGDVAENEIMIVNEPTFGVGYRAKEIGKVYSREMEHNVHIVGTDESDAESKRLKWSQAEHKIGTLEYYIKQGSPVQVQKGPYTVLLDSVKFTQKSPTRYDLALKFTEVTVFS